MREARRQMQRTRESDGESTEPIRLTRISNEKEECKAYFTGSIIYSLSSLPVKPPPLQRAPSLSLDTTVST